MPDEALISEIENILAEVIELGGANERSSIVPNLTVQDANPAKTGFIIVSDDRDGDNIFAKKVGSVIYSDNDKVNVVFPRGGEAIAFQQGSQSANNGIWEIVPSTTTDIYYDKGKVGIGTATIPHGGVGWAKVAIDGVDFDEAGPHMQFTTDADDYPVIQIFPWGHDENAINFDSYYDGSWRSSTTDQNFQILATGGRLRFRYDSGVAAGAVLSWNEGIALRDDGTVGLGTISPAAKLESVLSTGAQLRLSHTTASKFADFTVDTNHDLTIKPSSTGQIKLQPTTDSIDFFQILDADGGTPVLNVDATNERVGIGTAAPTALLDVSGTGTVGIFGDGTSSVGLNFDGAAGSVRDMVWLSGGSARWIFRVDSTAEAGANAGSNFVIQSRTDAGGGLASPFFIERSSGNVGIGTVSPSTRLDIDAGAMEFAEMTAPAAGAANTARLYAEDNAGTTRQRIKFSSGNAVTIAEDGGLQTYTITNVTTDRTYDANATTVAELADVLGTLIADFQAAGVLG